MRLFLAGGGQVPQVVRGRPVWEGAQVLAAVAAGDGHAPDAPLLGQGHALPLGEHPAVGELVSGHLAVFPHQAGDGLGVLVGHGVHDVDVGGEAPDPAVLLFHSGFPFPRCRAKPKSVHR